MDLIDAISKILHFQYRFEMVPDGKCNKPSKFLNYHPISQESMAHTTKSQNSGMAW